MNEKLMPVAKAILQTIKRVLWGTYCGFRQCVLLLFIFALTNSDWMIPEIGVMLLLSLSYALFYHWVTAFITAECGAMACRPPRVRMTMGICR